MLGDPGHCPAGRPCSGGWLLVSAPRFWRLALGVNPVARTLAWWCWFLLVTTSQTQVSTCSDAEIYWQLQVGEIVSKIVEKR